MISVMHGDKVLSPKQRYDRARYRRLKQEREAARPPDQIAAISDLDLAYIAGLIDGEGSIHVAKARDCLYPQVVVAMTDRGVIDWLAERLGAGNVQLHNSANLRRHPTYRKQWRVMVTGRRAHLLCQRLLPFLKVKHPQAELVLTFPVDARAGAAQRLDPAISEMRQRLRSELSALNGR